MHLRPFMGVSLVASLALFGTAQAGSVVQQGPIQLEKSPYSGSVLVARGIRNGSIRMPKASPRISYVAPPLNCKHAPCALPNVDASSGTTQPVNETPIAINPMNQKQLITGGNDYNCTSSSYRGFWTSNNSGRTWSGGCGSDAAGTSGGDGDPVVGYDLNGNAYQGGIDNGNNGLVISIASSGNNGSTWNTPVVATSVSGFSSDKPWLQIDNDPVSPNKNTLYLSSTQFAANNNSAIYVAHSTDGGQTWTQVQASPETTYPNIDQFSDLATDAKGDIYLTYMNCTANGPTGDCGGTTATLYFQESTDGGNTWSTPSVITTANLAPDTCGGFYGCLPNTYERVSEIPVVAVDRTGGKYSAWVYVTYYNWTGKYMQVMVITCASGWPAKPGMWSTPVAVAPRSDKHDQFFPWLSVNNKGKVGVTWLDRRNDPSNVEYDAYATWSDNGAASFGKNIDMSTQPSDPFNDGFGGGFMGDYSGNTWIAKRLYASWTDTRNGNFAQDEVGGVKVKH